MKYILVFFISINCSAKNTESCRKRSNLSDLLYLSEKLKQPKQKPIQLLKL